MSRNAISNGGKVRFNNMKAGVSLQNMRLKHNLTQKQLSDLFSDNGTPATENCISRWERGICMPSWDRLAFLVWLYDCTLDDLVMDSSDNTNPTIHSILIKQYTNRNYIFKRMHIIMHSLFFALLS